MRYDRRVGRFLTGGHIPGVIHIPVPDLRFRHGELDPDAPCVMVCNVGQRASLAASLDPGHATAFVQEIAAQVAISPTNAEFRFDEGAGVLVPVVDSVCDPHGLPVDRDQLRSVQTPQGFAADALRRVHATRPEATDDASLIEADGGRVAVFHWRRPNDKITTPEDLELVEHLLSVRNRQNG